MEEPYGFFGALNPTGHTAIFLQRVCTETPVKLRRCRPGELGTVIARYQGIDCYDWVAIPLIPYLYSVEDVPSGSRPRRSRLVTASAIATAKPTSSLGNDVSAGSFLHGGWNELVGVAYERRIYAFHFQTTSRAGRRPHRATEFRPNRSHFDLFTATALTLPASCSTTYFPGTFHRSSSLTPA